MYLHLWSFFSSLFLMDFKIRHEDVSLAQRFFFPNPPVFRQWSWGTELYCLQMTFRRKYRDSKKHTFCLCAMVWLFWPISVTSKWCNKNLDSEEHWVVGSPCKNISGVVLSEKCLRAIQFRVSMCWQELLRSVSAVSHHGKGLMVLQAFTKSRATRDCFSME